MVLRTGWPWSGWSGWSGWSALARQRCSQLGAGLGPARVCSGTQTEGLCLQGRYRAPDLSGARHAAVASALQGHASVFTHI